MGLPKFAEIVGRVRDLEQRLSVLEQQGAGPVVPSPETRLGDEFCEDCGSRLGAGHFDNCQQHVAGEAA